MNFNPPPQLNTFPSSQEAENKQEFIKLYGHCSRIGKIKSGDVMPVGGSMFSDSFSEAGSLKLISDISVFSDFYKKPKTKQRE